MIRDIIVGDITSHENASDIIIGMNTTLNDVTGIGLPFVNKINTLHPLTLGGVLSFKDGVGIRRVHMLICHNLGRGGWENADQFVRFGMDFLWHTEPIRLYSIVQIGTGRVGVRDGANPSAIHTAMALSHLPVDLFVLNSDKQIPDRAAMTMLRPYRAWTPAHGVEEIHVAA